MTKRFKIIVEYDGRPFAGWQVQKNCPTVQEEIEKAIFEFSGENLRIVSAGRTDAGVHALGQAASFDLEMNITPKKLREAINSTLRPNPIAILEVKEVDKSFSARFSAKKRHYLYKIINRRPPLTFNKGQAWLIPLPLDHEKMHEGAQILVGRHDFTTFRNVKCQAKSAVKTLEKLEVAREGETINIRATAESFLHNQIRSMVGALHLVGCGKWSLGDLGSALEAKDRQRGGFNAPPDGLYFLKVDF